MHIELSTEELATLKTAVDRMIRVLDAELVRTDAPSMQHAAAADVDRLRRVRERLEPGESARPRA